MSGMLAQVCGDLFTDLGRQRPLRDRKSECPGELLGAGDFLAMVGRAIATAAEWVAAGFIWFRDGLEWVLTQVVAVVAGFVLIHVAVLLGFNQIGRAALLPIPSAIRAGSDQGKCADTAAGMGMAQSLLLTATVLDPKFRFWFIDLWEATPVVCGSPRELGVHT